MARHARVPLLVLVAGACWLAALDVAALPQEGLTAEEDAARQAFADDNFEAIVAPQNKDFFASAPVAAAPEAMQALGYLGSPAKAGPAPYPGGEATIAPPGGAQVCEVAKAELSIAQFAALRAELKTLARRTGTVEGPTVTLGASAYAGRAVKGALELHLSLGVTLGKPGAWKTVPLVGDDVVLVRAVVDGRPIAVARLRGYHVWQTTRDGEVAIELDILVPSRGRRGSLEYDFLVARTAVTRFDCAFPEEGLEPRLDTAVQSDVTAEPGATRLAATLRPTTRVHLVGFKSMGEDDGQPARIYAEASSLLSVGERALEVFTVIRYKILYAGAKRFDIAVPRDMAVLSADGEGAFRYAVETGEDGATVLRGETAFPIRNEYEISLRLKRQLSKQDGERGAAFDVPLPRCVGVERENGWLAVEVPGKLKLNEVERVEALAVDVRQLPLEMVSSAVSPIIKAYRYHAVTSRIRLSAVRLPELEPKSASVDRVRAFSVVSAEGKVLTDLKISLRNRLTPTLALDVPEGVEVRSAHLDGVTIQPSRDENGKLVLPLKRSEGGERPAPFTLQIVLESRLDPLGLFGQRRLALPAIALPVSSASWSVFLPSNNAYSGLEGDVDAEPLAAEASWHQPVGSAAPVRFGSRGRGPDENDGAALEAAGGSMSIRIEIPRSGIRLESDRFWLAERAPLEVSFWFLRGWLRLPLGILAALAMAAGLVFAAAWRRGGRRRLEITAGLVVAALAAWP
ncbi:MAG: hypothetical protein M0R80_26960, partial [Proteobacteria bacterium]|nr:hypothetical protein [Pseudomonadota bacterium]